LDLLVSIRVLKENIFIFTYNAGEFRAEEILRLGHMSLLPLDWLKEKVGVDLLRLIPRELARHVSQVFRLQSVSCHMILRFTSIVAALLPKLLALSLKVKPGHVRLQIVGVLPVPLKHLFRGQGFRLARTQFAYDHVGDYLSVLQAFNVGRDWQIVLSEDRLDDLKLLLDVRLRRDPAQIVKVLEHRIDRLEHPGALLLFPGWLC